MMRDEFFYPGIHFWRVMRGFATLISISMGAESAKRRYCSSLFIFNNPLSALTDYFFIIDEYKLTLSK